MTVRGRASARRSAGWFATLVAMLLAFSWQSVVTQTHQHLNPAVAGKADGADSMRPDRQSPFDLPANCPICREIAHAGPALLPAPIVVAAPAPPPVWRAETAGLRKTLASRSHAWRSRAPPLQLQG